MTRIPEAFLRVWGALPQAAPGSDASTVEALRRIADRLTDAPRVLDIGCGPGRQTFALARALPRARIVAVDVHEPFLERIAARARELGLSDRVATRAQSMDALSDAPGSVDLLWCEGAAYAIGVERALEAWRALLAPGGVLAYTDLVWTSDARPDEAVRFLASEYPEMVDVPRSLARAERAGYAAIDHFVLPESDFWTGFYAPLEARCAELRPEAGHDADLAAVIAQAEREIGVYRRHSGAYGYAFFLLVRSPSTAASVP